jgi:hypothetical protein
VRRLGGLIAALIVFLLVPPAPAPAQDGAVTLRLVRQTPYATPEDPLKVGIEVTNGTEAPLEDLTLTVRAFIPTGSRSAYQEALEFDQIVDLANRSEPVEGVVEPGKSLRLPVMTVELPPEALLYGSGLLPVKVELLSAGFPVAVLRTAVVFVEEEPQVPLNVNLTFELDAPLRMLPDGSFVEQALTPELAPEGRLEALLAALEESSAETSFPVTVVVSPLLLEQLARMSSGYRLHVGTSLVTIPRDDDDAVRAAEFLERLTAVAQRPDTELVALPYASPSIPALVPPQLGQDLLAQISRGRATVSRLLGVAASETLFRPPGGNLTAASVEALAGVGVETLLLGADAVEPLEALDFSPPPDGFLTSGSGITMEVIVPDPGVAARLGALPDDPRLRAQLLIGELSAIYFEFPSVDRGVSIFIDGSTTPEPLFLSSLVRALTGLPRSVSWLRPAKASRMLTTREVGAAEGSRRRELVPSRGPQFSEVFLSEMAETQAILQQYAAVAGEDTPLLFRLRGLRFIAESRWLLRKEEEALAFMRAARAAVHREFAKVEAPSPSAVTLTSRNGVIPVTIHNQADYDMRVTLVLQSPRLEVIGGPGRVVTLTRPEQLFTFQVRAQTTGRFPVDVFVETPNGARIAQSQIVVRSTAYNLVALVVTIGAALFLAAWWGRRFLPRRA